MICQNCGTANPEQGKFCKGCGQALFSAPVLVPEPEASPRSRRLTAVLSAVILLILAAAVIAGAFLLGKHDDLEGVELDNDAESMIEEVTETASTEVETTTPQSTATLAEDSNEITLTSTETTEQAVVTLAESSQEFQVTTSAEVVTEKNVVNRTIKVDTGSNFTVWEIKFRNNRVDDGIQSIKIKINMKMTVTYSDETAYYTTFDCFIEQSSGVSGVRIITTHPKQDDFGNACLEGDEMRNINNAIGDILIDFITPSGRDENGYPIYEWMKNDYIYDVGLPTGEYAGDAKYCTLAALNYAINVNFFPYGDITLRDAMAGYY